MSLVGRRGAGEVGLEAGEEEGRKRRLKNGLCHGVEESRRPSAPRELRRREVAAQPKSPVSGSASGVWEDWEGMGTPPTEDEDWGGFPVAFKRDAAVPAAIAAPEKRKARTQQGAHRLPVLAACPPVSTSADFGLPRATRAAPSDVIQARLDRSRSGPPPPEELGGVAEKRSAQVREC